jgi:hypothetical protein
VVISGPKAIGHREPIIEVPISEMQTVPLEAPPEVQP